MGNWWTRYRLLHFHQPQSSRPIVKDFGSHNLGPVCWSCTILRTSCCRESRKDGCLSAFQPCWTGGYCQKRLNFAWIQLSSSYVLLHSLFDLALGKLVHSGTGGGYETQKPTWYWTYTPSQRWIFSWRFIPPNSLTSQKARENNPF